MPHHLQRRLCETARRQAALFASFAYFRGHRLPSRVLGCKLAHAAPRRRRHDGHLSHRPKEGRAGPRLLRGAPREPKINSADFGDIADWDSGFAAAVPDLRNLQNLWIATVRGSRTLKAFMNTDRRSSGLGSRPGFTTKFTMVFTTRMTCSREGTQRTQRGTIGVMAPALVRSLCPGLCRCLCLNPNDDACGGWSSSRSSSTPKLWE